MFLKIQLIISQHWFRLWLGAKQVTSHYLNQWWFSLLMHTCIIRPQWVKEPQGFYFVQCLWRKHFPHKSYYDHRYCPQNCMVRHLQTQGWLAVLVLSLISLHMTSNGLVQDCSNSIADSLELLQWCTKPLKYRDPFLNASQPMRDDITM